MLGQRENQEEAEVAHLIPWRGAASDISYKAFEWWPGYEIKPRPFELTAHSTHKQSPEGHPELHNNNGLIDKYITKT